MTSYGFRAYGDPSPQGSKIPGVRADGGRFVRDQGGQKLKDWRKVLTEAAELARGKDTEQEIPTIPKEVPVAVQIMVFVPRPKTVKRQLPCVKPDLDKMVRAILDSMKDAGVFADDGQVVKIWALKQYADAHPDTQGLPGAWVTVTDQLG